MWTQGVTIEDKNAIRSQGQAGVEDLARSEGKQSSPPQNMLLGMETEYFRLVIFKKQTQEKPLTFPQKPKRI